MHDDDLAEREQAVGQLLRQARGRESQRAVAARAGCSPTQWRHMEQGQREHGVPVRPSDKLLEAAALAVHLDPAVLFAAAGRPYDGPILPPTPQEEGRLDALERRMSSLEASVSRLLDDD